MRPGATRSTPPQLARAGRHVVVATGTASGKSLAYQLPALTRLAEDPRRLRPLPRADQGPGPRPARRRWPRSPTPRCGRRPTTATPRARSGTGCAGTHGGSSPTRTCCTAGSCPPTRGGRARCAGSPTWSSTSATPTAACSARTSATCCAGCAGSAAATGPTRCSCSPRRPWPTRPRQRPGWSARRSTAVTDDGSPRPGATFALWEPPLTERTGEHGAPLRRSAAADAATLLADLVERGARTLAFVRSRRSAESVADQARRLLRDRGRDDLVRRVDSYRGGYLPEERRELERALSAGRPAGRGHHQRPRARHRHRRPRRGRARRLPGHAGLAVAAGRAGRGGRRRSRWSSSSPATTRWTTTSPTIRGRCSAGRSRPPSPTRPTPTSSAPSCAAPRPSCRCARRTSPSSAGPVAEAQLEELVAAGPAAPPTGRLVLGRAGAARRRHPRQRRRAGVDHRGGHRPAARHRRRRRRALDGARRRPLRAPRRHLRRRRVRRRRRLRGRARRAARSGRRSPATSPTWASSSTDRDPAAGHRDRAHRRRRRDQPGRRLPAAAAGHR